MEGKAHTVGRNDAVAAVQNRDLERINAAHRTLSAEAADVLEYQAGLNGLPSER